MNRVCAVAGGSGSGKSTLAKALLAACGPECLAVLPIDAYYHDLSHLDAGAREEVNFDHPDALDLQLFSATWRRCEQDSLLTVRPMISPRTVVRLPRSL